MGTWISTDSGSCGFFGSQERKSADQRENPGRYQADVSGGFWSNSSAGRNIQNITCGYHTGAISGSGADESNRLSAIAVAYARI